MPHCVNCGLPIPAGQRTCSMCYGDPEHGSDGYYNAWLMEEARRQAEERLEEEAHRERGGRHVD